MIHLLLEDEDFPRPAVSRLRELGYDVLTLRELELDDQGFPDDLVMQTAIEQKRVVLTHNRKDYLKLHKTLEGKHFGIIISTRFVNKVLLADTIHSKIKDIESMEGQLIRITRPNLG